MIKIRKRHHQEYLYILRKVYKRDKRTTIKKNKYLGDGSKTLERWKFTENKEIYAGKIVKREVNYKKLKNFKNYLKDEKNIEWLDLIINKDFFDITEAYVDYLLWMHDIPREEYETKNLYYEIGNGYLGKKTIEELYHFYSTPGEKNRRQMYGFTLRCIDASIEDKDVVRSLYNHILIANGEPGLKKEDFYNTLKEEIEELENEEKISISFEEFMRKSKEFEEDK